MTEHLQTYGEVKSVLALWEMQSSHDPREWRPISVVGFFEGGPQNKPVQRHSVQSEINHKFNCTQHEHRPGKLTLQRESKILTASIWV